MFPFICHVDTCTISVSLIEHIERLALVLIESTCNTRV